MTLNFHEHFTGLELVVVIIVEILWWGGIYFVAHKWWKNRKNRTMRGERE